MPESQGKNSGVVIPRRLDWSRHMAASIGALAFGLSMKTWRCRWNDRADPSQAEAPVIYCIWHKHFAMAVRSYDDHAKKKWNDKGLFAMVSASGDGAFLTSVLAKFNVGTIRGSTSRRGPQALLEASRWLRKGYSVAVTPDGPRGPAHQVQDGVISLAQVSGRAIVPISYFTNWKICLNSWDRFQIPLPFCRCEFYDNPPISVPRDATAEDRERFRLKLEASLKEITQD